MRARYLDTSALCYNLRHSGQPSILGGEGHAGSSPELAGPLVTGIASYFAPNATMAMLPFVEYRTNVCGWKLDRSDHCSDIHPVIEKAISALPTPRYASGTMRISTLVNWVTGQLDNGLITQSIMPSASDLVIIDAAQAFGLLTKEEVADLGNRIREGAIVIGCLQKWLESPVPLGFALMPVSLLDSDSGLRDYLACRDYLGYSVQPRYGFADFGDTYSSPLATILDSFLRRALGQCDDEYERRRALVARNREKLYGWVCESTALSPSESTRHARGMVAVQGRSDAAEAISQQLLRYGFLHTAFRDVPTQGATTLRLSAPCVEMDQESQSILISILGRPHE